MSPEQMRSAARVDARADIWALGVILHELITGSAPFDGTTMPDLLASILQDRPVPLSWLRPDAPPALEAVIAKCLQKEPGDRYTDVAELTQALALLRDAFVARVRRSRLARDSSGGNRGLDRARAPVAQHTSGRAGAARAAFGGHGHRERHGERVGGDGSPFAIGGANRGPRRRQPVLCVRAHPGASLAPRRSGSRRRARRRRVHRRPRPSRRSRRRPCPSPLTIPRATSSSVASLTPRPPSR